jgi:predicted NBD/HSP70 family sugar kinase
MVSFDVGGTDIKWAVCSLGGEVLRHGAWPTPNASGGAGVVRALVQRVQDLCPPGADALVGVAVSTLGLVDVDSGVVWGAADAIPGYAGTALKAELQAALGVPVSVENDVNCVALAEATWGSAQGVSDVLAVALGTGIGGAVILGGQLHRGHRGAAGEWGTQWVDGAPWESQASLQALVQRIHQHRCDQARAEGRSDPSPWNGREIFAALDAGQTEWLPHIQQWAGHVGRGLANLVYVLNPQRIVIGGGITGRGEPLRVLLNDALNQALHPDFRGMTEVVLAQAGNLAGCLGALRHWMLSYPQIE